MTDGEYFSCRARDEREAAMRAAHPRVRQTHIDLADAYECRIRALAAAERRLAIGLVKTG
jgi:hypothetical protein